MIKRREDEKVQRWKRQGAVKWDEEYVIKGRMRREVGQREVDSSLDASLSAFTPFSLESARCEGLPQCV